ncbi:MAG: hypothetical protein H8E17_02970 [Deltaproteobacteria bacterium]|nr:hypothetical protein [Deltaproteobacteria bacterium]
MSEIPVWAIWLIIVTGAFVVGIGVGYLLQGPKTWPGEVWKLRHDNEVMRLQLKEISELAEQKRTPGKRGLVTRF